MTTGLKADLYMCPECGRPLEGSGKFKTVTKPTRTMRELECGHWIPYEKRPVFKRDVQLDRQGNKNSMPTREENARRLQRETKRRARPVRSWDDWHAKGHEFDIQQD